MAYGLLTDLLGQNAYKVTISNPENDWLNVAQLPISWDVAALGGSQVSVDILLVGYRQEGSPGQEQVPHHCCTCHVLRYHVMYMCACFVPT